MARNVKSKKRIAVEVVKADEAGAVAVLNADEKRELKKCEAVIGRGWDTFVEVGKALAAIQRDRLYREKHKTFEAYCRERWQYGKSHAHRLIGAAEVVEHLSPIGDKLPLPMNEAQVRPLIGLEPEAQLKAWRAAVEQASGKHVTAKLVREAAEPYLDGKRKRPAPSTRRQAAVPAAALERVEAALAALAGNDLTGVRSALEELRGLLSTAR